MFDKSLIKKKHEKFCPETYFRFMGYNVPENLEKLDDFKLSILFHSTCQSDTENIVDLINRLYSNTLNLRPPMIPTKWGHEIQVHFHYKT